MVFKVRNFRDLCVLSYYLAYVKATVIKYDMITLESDIIGIMMGLR